MQQWVVALYWGIHYPLAWIFIEVFDFLDTYVIQFYTERIGFY
jgi:hypothetical protein